MLMMFKALSSWMDEELFQTRKRRSKEVLNRASFAIVDARNAIVEYRDDLAKTARGQTDGK